HPREVGVGLADGGLEHPYTRATRFERVGRKDLFLPQPLVDAELPPRFGKIRLSASNCGAPAGDLRLGLLYLRLCAPNLRVVILVLETRDYLILAHARAFFDTQIGEPPLDFRGDDRFAT